MDKRQFWLNYMKKCKIQFRVNTNEHIFKTRGGDEGVLQFMWWGRGSRLWSTAVGYYYDIFVEHELGLCLWRTAETQPSITHSQTHSLCIRERKQWCYLFIPPSNQRSLHSHQLPWQLCSDWYSCIPGSITDAAETIPKDHKKTCGASMKCFSHCLVYIGRKTTTGAIYPWQREVILRLNADPCQSGCILISHENCWYKWNHHVCLCMQKQ